MAAGGRGRALMAAAAGGRPPPLLPPPPTPWRGVVLFLHRVMNQGLLGSLTYICLSVYRCCVYITFQLKHVRIFYNLPLGYFSFRLIRNLYISGV